MAAAQPNGNRLQFYPNTTRYDAFVPMRELLQLQQITLSFLEIAFFTGASIAYACSNDSYSEKIKDIHVTRRGIGLLDGRVNRRLLC
jgi:hypothetical protein